MDELKNLYQSWIREEVENPEVQKAKEIFLREHFEATSKPSAWALFSMPVFRFALAGCLAAFVIFKVVGIDHPTPTTLLDQTEAKIDLVSTDATSALKTKPDFVSKAEEIHLNSNEIQIKKLGSQVGPTVAFQKNFPDDVQITVLWVFPKGV